MSNNKEFDVIIVGGSYAGLSAGMSLGRSLKQVLIIDSGLPCNRQTPHSQNFITQDGEKPIEIAKKAKLQVSRYQSIEFYQGIAEKGEILEKGFEITTQQGDKFTSSKLIFATGIRDIMPDISGFSECWGKSVIHCPYCHGYEHRNKKTGIFISNERAFHLTQLVNNLTDKLSILTSGVSIFNDEQLEKLGKHQIPIIEDQVIAFEHKHGQIKNIVFEGNKKVSFDTIYSSVPFEQHCNIPVDLGCELNEQGYIKVDGFQKTNIPGIYAIGDCSSPMRSVANAVAAGNFAGAMVNMELTEERF